MKSSLLALALACSLSPAFGQDAPPPPEPPPPSDEGDLPPAEEGDEEGGDSEGEARPKPARPPVKVQLRDAGKLDLECAGHSLREVLRAIGVRVKKTLVVAPEVEEQVTVSLKSVPWRECVEVLARMCRCELTALEEDVLLVRQPARVTLELQETPIAQACSLIARSAGASVIVGPGVRGTVTLSLESVGPYEALAQAARAAGVHALRRGDLVLVTRQELPAYEAPAPLKLPTTPRINVDVEGSHLVYVLAQLGRTGGVNLVAEDAIDEELSCALFELPLASAVRTVAYLTDCELERGPGGVVLFRQGPRLQLDLQDVSLSSLVPLVAAYSGTNLLADSKLTDRVSLHLEEVLAAELFQALALVSGAKLERDEAGVRYLRPAGAKPAIPAPATPPSISAAKPRLNLDVEEQDLRKLCQAIGKQAGVEVLVDPEVRSEPLTIALRDLPWRQALEVVARITGCSVREAAEGAFLLAQPPRVLICAERAPLGAMLELIAQQGKLKLAPTALLRGEVRFDLKQLSWPDALRAVATLGGCRVERAGETLRVVQEQAPAALPKREALSAEESEPWVGPTAASLKRLGERAEQLMREINRFSERQEVDELVSRFAALRELMNEPGGVDAAREAMKRWRQRLLPFGEVVLSLELQLHISAGNQHLRAMADAITGDRYPDALRSFKALQGVVDDLRAQEREVYHRNADALLLRGKALADRARRLQAFATRYPNRVAATLIPTKGDLQGPAALVEGRVVRVGGRLPDPRTGDFQPDAPRIVEITRGVVRLRWQDAEFVRALE